MRLTKKQVELLAEADDGAMQVGDLSSWLCLEQPGDMACAAALVRKGLARLDGIDMRPTDEGRLALYEHHGWILRTGNELVLTTKGQRNLVLVRRADEQKEGR